MTSTASASDRALDDFGSGLSGLSRLPRSPVDIVTIDQAFMGALDDESGGAAMITAMTEYAHALQLGVIRGGRRTSSMTAHRVRGSGQPCTCVLRGRPGSASTGSCSPARHASICAHTAAP